MDELLEVAARLALAASRIPRGDDWDFACLDSSFESGVANLVAQCDDLCGALLQLVGSDNATSAVDDLLSSECLAESHAAGGGRQPDQYQKRVIGDYTVYFANCVQAVPSFVSTRALPSEIPVVTQAILQLIPAPFTVGTSTNVVQTSADCVAACRDLEAEPALLVSVLQNRVRYYHPVPCWVVVAGRCGVNLFDCLVLRDLDPLWDLLASDQPKVVADPDEALPVLSRAFGAWVARVVDVGDALDAGGGAIVDWRIRPLDAQLASIAASSVLRLLPALYLDRRGFVERSARFGAPPVLPCPDHEQEVGRLLRRAEERGVQVDERVVSALAAWREATAELEGEGVQWLLPDGAVIELAAAAWREDDLAAALAGAKVSPKTLALRSEILLCVAKARGAHVDLLSRLRLEQR